MVAQSLLILFLFVFQILSIIISWYSLRGTLKLLHQILPRNSHWGPFGLELHYNLPLALPKQELSTAFTQTSLYPGGVVALLTLVTNTHMDVRRYFVSIAFWIRSFPLRFLDRDCWCVKIATDSFAFSFCICSFDSDYSDSYSFNSPGFSRQTSISITFVVTVFPLLFHILSYWEVSVQMKLLILIIMPLLFQFKMWGWPLVNIL